MMVERWLLVREYIKKNLKSPKNLFEADDQNLSE